MTQHTIKGKFVGKQDKPRSGERADSGNREKPAPNATFAEDVPYLPGMALPEPGRSRFEDKHWLSLITGLMISDPQRLSEHTRREYLNMGVAVALVVSGGLNLVQAHYPKMPPLLVSMSNDTHDLIRTATMARPLNTTHIVTDWAQRTVCSILTLGFSDYDERLTAARGAFTTAGYNGFDSAVRRDLIPGIISEGLMLSTAPDLAPVISHYPSYAEPYWDVQVPVVMSFSRGNARSDRSSRRLVTVRIVPVDASVSVYGRAIDQITIEAASD